MCFCLKAIGSYSSYLKWNSDPLPWSTRLCPAWALPFLLHHLRLFPSGSQIWITLASKQIKLISALEHPCCWCCCLQPLFPGLLLFKFQARFHLLLRFFLVIQSKPHPQSFYSIPCYISFAAFIYCVKLSYLTACFHSTTREVQESRARVCAVPAVVLGLGVEPGI